MTDLAGPLRALTAPTTDAVEQLARLGQDITKRPTPEPTPRLEDDPELELPAWEPPNPEMVAKRADAVAAHYHREGTHA